MNKNVLENRMIGPQEDDVEMELQQYKHKKRKIIIHNFLREDTSYAVKSASFK